MHKRTFEGIWWIAGQPTDKLPGLLEFDPTEGLRLKLSGVLTSEDLFSIRATRIPVIHGEVSGPDGGGLATLFRCIRGRTEISRVERQELLPELAAIGAHLGSEEQIAIASAEVSYSQLPNWLETGGFALQINADKVVAGEPVSYDVHYRPVSLPEIVTERATMDFVLRSIPPIFATRTLPLQEWVGMRVRPALPMSLGQFRRDI